MIGIDIIEIPRIAAVLERTPEFISKSFTQREIAYFESKNMSPATIAGSWAAKEAFSKALRTGVRGFSLIDVEVMRNYLGAPSIRYKGRRIYTQTAISHSKENAVAVVAIPWWSRLYLKTK